ncbi:VWA domain-containing protein [Avibacterium paragallinarum]|uniref:VWA domain protein interacting with AAA ATPase n=1 Tax=Avibacterium paragallinarum TaxID=728 RepID=A0A377I7F4_AVIPA|nr:VWA domain-containing protein [Avibacterium paragallinarum]POY47475.1 VWA domain-containing protein [Avibacterium paragallinarum]RZN75642.1 VWA domain-containing protein [Avibacterium paragallinarum]STO71278.1 VWA domain protein interacting with AAA ATPase [Avibacterium paragallinarum]
MKSSQYQKKRQTYLTILEDESNAEELFKSYQSFCQDMAIHFDSEFWQEKLQTEENDLFCDFARFKWKNDLKKIETLYQHFKKYIYKGMRKEKRNSSKLNELIEKQFLPEYKKLQQENPFKSYYHKIAHYENNANPTNSKDENKQDTDNSFTTQLLDDYKAFCNANNLSFDFTFLEKKINSGEEQKMLYDYLLQQWKKELDKVEYKWQQAKISLNIKSFKEKLNLSIFFLLGISDDIDNLTPQDTKFLEILNTQLKKVKKLKEILDLLGRAFGKNNATKIKKEMENAEQHNPVIDYRAKEEIVGLYLGKELENILPAELALLNNEESAVLFDLKFLENKLMCFQQQGITFATQSQSTPKEVAEDERTGPMILCVDTSGSMMGDPENIAKAIALYPGQEAKAQKRAYFIINFSKQIVTYEHTKRKTIENLISFLQGSFHGSTDVEPALNYALDLLQRKNYAKADVLVISDFEIPPFSLEIHEKIEMQKQKKTKFNALAISSQNNINSLLSIFDNQWKYSPKTGEIVDLIKPTSSP